MTNRETGSYEMLVRVRDFGKAHGDRFPKSTMGGEAFKAVDVALDELNQHAAAQVSSRSATRSGPSTDTAGYRELVAMLNAISVTARDSAVMATWQVARRIYRHRGTRGRAAPPTASPNGASPDSTPPPAAPLVTPSAAPQGS